MYFFCSFSYVSWCFLFFSIRTPLVSVQELKAVEASGSLGGWDVPAQQDKCAAPKSQLSLFGFIWQTSASSDWRQLFLKARSDSQGGFWSGCQSWDHLLSGRNRAEKSRWRVDQQLADNGAYEQYECDAVHDRKGKRETCNFPQIICLDILAKNDLEK